MLGSIELVICTLTFDEYDAGQIIRIFDTDMALFMADHADSIRGLQTELSVLLRAEPRNCTQARPCGVLLLTEPRWLLSRNLQRDDLEFRFDVDVETRSRIPVAVQAYRNRRSITCLQYGFRRQ